MSHQDGKVPLNRQGTFWPGPIFSINHLSNYLRYNTRVRRGGRDT
jgi:hypothetical protein